MEKGKQDLALAMARIEKAEHQQRVATKDEVKTEGQPAQRQPAQGSGSMVQEVATEGQPVQGQPAQGSHSKQVVLLHGVTARERTKMRNEMRQQVRQQIRKQKLPHKDLVPLIECKECIY